jgi:hypothetical protein
MNNANATKTPSRDITIYTVGLSPYAQRTRILLAIDNIDAKLRGQGALLFRLEMFPAACPLEDGP